MEEKVYALTYAPAIEGAYAGGPTKDLASLLAETPDEGIEAEIHIVDKDADPVVVLRWADDGWTLDEMAPLDETEISYLGMEISLANVVGKKPPSDPFAPADEVKAIILDEMGLEESQEHMLFTAKVVGFTCESTARPGEYQSVRGYWNLVEPDPGKLVIPIFNPAREVDGDTGNLALFGKVFKLIARELDLAVTDTAHRRLDRQIAKSDAQARTASSGIQLKGRPRRKEEKAQPQGEAL